jgi:hypothetical protein
MDDVFINVVGKDEVYVWVCCISKKTYA